MKDILALARGAIYSFWYNNFRKNISVGPGLKVYKKFKISGQGNLEIGSNCSIDGIKGDNSQFVCIDLRCPTAVIKIGNGVTLLAARLTAKFEIRIGDGVIIEESAVIDTDFHTIDRNREEPEHEKREKCKVTIGDRVSIGARSIVMKGVTIGDDVVVLPSSVIVNSIKRGLVVSGNPARPIKMI